MTFRDTPDKLHRKGRAPAAAAVTALLVAGLLGACGDDSSPSAGDDDAGSKTAEGGVLPLGKDVHGVTDKVIRIGMTTSDAKAGAALIEGSTGQQVGGAYQYAHDKVNAAAVEAVNTTGGIAGRQVEAVESFYDTAKFSTASGRQQENQKACARWTEDNDVFAFDGSAGTEEVMVECARRAKTPWVVVGYHLFVAEQRFKSMSDFYYAPPSFLADRRERSLASFLVEKRFFGEGAKVALMIEDRPDTREGVTKGMKPVLEKAGIKPAVEIVYPDFMQSPWANYVLQLRDAGVTHVLWSASSAPGFAALGLMRAAEEQKYRPKWAVGTDTAPASLITFGAPAEQLANVQGMGWQPAFDTGVMETDTPRTQACLAAMQKHGQTDTPVARAKCEYLFFLQAAFAKADEVSPKGLAEGVEKLGNSYTSTVTSGGATRFGRNRHDGVSMVRSVTYDAAAKKFTYASPAEPIDD